MEIVFVACGSEARSSQLDEIKVHVKTEVGVDAEEVEECAGGFDEIWSCLKFTLGSAVCLIYGDDDD